MMRWRRHKKKLVVGILLLSILYAVLHFQRKERGVNQGDKIIVPSRIPKTFVITRGTAKGFLNVAIWEEICGHEMQSLKAFPLFPHGPSRRLRTSSLRLHFKPEFEDFGLRIFGFLSPNKSGSYTFYLASSGTSELWISADSKPENSKLIANTTAAGLSWKYSDNTPFLAGKRYYYLEIILKHGSHVKGKLNHLHVTWKSSSWKEQEPREIPADVLIAYEIDSNGVDHVRTLDRHTEVVLPIHLEHQDPRFVNDEVKRRAEMYLLPFISESDSKDLFPPCQYNPSYIVKRPLERYEGIWEMHYTSIYPYDHADVVEPKPEGVGDFLTFGNDPLDENTAKAIASQVWEQMQRKHTGKYSFVRILNVEENHDQGTGDRYLVELELKEISSGKSARFSEYVYRPWGVKTLCTPVGMAWNKSAVVNIILTTGNYQGRWILHFLNNIAEIHNRTKDFNFNVIIADFDSKDLDLRDAMRKAAIPSYQHVNIKENFRKVVGLQQAADMIRDPNSIVFVMDLHIDIPYHFLDDVRKHIIQDKMAYSPILIRLDCGSTPDRPLGFWEFNGLGLMGMYKSDWDRVGGMNVKEFKNKWGGEDWELSDRILQAGLEIERIKMMHLFHYFHSRQHMWVDTNMTVSDISDKYWY